MGVFVTYLLPGEGSFSLCFLGFYLRNEDETGQAKQEADGGGRVGKLRPTQLYYGEPTAYRALVATAAGIQMPEEAKL